MDTMKPDKRKIDRRFWLIASSCVLIGLLWFLTQYILDLQKRHKILASNTIVTFQNTTAKPLKMESTKNTIPKTLSIFQGKSDLSSSFAAENDEHMPSRTLLPLKMGYGPVYIYGAVAGNTSRAVAWDIVKIYASVNITSMYKHFMCCMRYNSENESKLIRKFVSVKRTTFKKAPIRTYHFTCENTLHTSAEIPDEVGLSVERFTCGHKYVSYVKPYLPLRKPGISLVIGTKLAYNGISAELIIEWMETYKYLGVDKVVTYFVEDINPSALKVLHHYASTGLLDLVYFELERTDLQSRKFDQKKAKQTLNDKMLTIYDSYERMSGYTFFGIIDHDELLIPSKGRTLKQLLVDLCESYAGAGGFVFQTRYNYLSWGASSNFNDLILGRYVNTTTNDPHLDRQKTISRTTAVSIGGIGTHYTKLKNGFQMQVVPSSEGFIHHFRQCRDNSTLCLKEYERITNMSVAYWSAAIEDNVHGVRRHVFGSDKRIP